MRLTSPASTVPEPISTNVSTPSATSDWMAWVNRTGAVSCSISSSPTRSWDSIALVTVDMNRVDIGANPTASIAGRNRSAAAPISGLWNAPVTRRRITLPPASLTRSETSATPCSRPEMTTWPGQL